MKVSIFISYRREDSADITGRIYDRLVQDFGKAFVFKDVDDIPFGVDFRQILNEAVKKCNVLLAVIGNNWLSIKSDLGTRRLDDPTDFVRIEINAALRRNILVIPLLVQNAQMPSPGDLPSDLETLCYRNGLPIRRDPDFHKDMDRLIGFLKKYFEEVTIEGIEQKPTQKSIVKEKFAEVDLSGKIESTTEPTIICLQNDTSYSLFIDGKTKGEILSRLRERKPKRTPTKHRVLLYSTLLFCLLKNKISSLNRVVIDNEYHGYEANIKEHILNLFKNEQIIVPSEKIIIKTLPDTPAYSAAIDIRLKSYKPNLIINADDVFRVLKII